MWNIMAGRRYSLFGYLDFNVQIRVRVRFPLLVYVRSTTSVSMQ